MTTPQPAALPESATVLPDGSAFAIASFPLPADHWLYAPREYRDGEDDPIELPAPILNHRDHGDAVRAAIRYAVRSATMCGKEEDFDPDALVQNAMYALCGPFGAATLQSQPAEVSDERLLEIGREWTKEIGWYEFEVNDFIGCARAILALRPQSEPMTEEQAVLEDEEFSLLSQTQVAALLWVLWCHQGASSPVGQPIRFALGMDKRQAMSDEQVSAAQRFRIDWHQWSGITAPAGGVLHAAHQATKEPR